jgi:hypothetical protein
MRQKLLAYTLLICYTYALGIVCCIFQFLARKKNLKILIHNPRQNGMVKQTAQDAVPLTQLHFSQFRPLLHQFHIHIHCFIPPPPIL